MLVLTLKEGQQVVVPVIGIVITVVRCSGGRVRLGFEAPKTIKFLRSTLLRKDDAISLNEHGNRATALHSLRPSEIGENPTDSNL